VCNQQAFCISLQYYLHTSTTTQIIGDSLCFHKLLFCPRLVAYLFLADDGDACFLYVLLFTFNEIYWMVLIDPDGMPH